MAADATAATTSTARTCPTGFDVAPTTSMPSAMNPRMTAAMTP